MFYCWGETNYILLSNYTRKFARMLAFSKKKILWNGHVATIRKTTTYRIMVRKIIKRIYLKTKELIKLQRCSQENKFELDLRALCSSDKNLVKLIKNKNLSRFPCYRLAMRSITKVQFLTGAKFFSLLPGAHDVSYSKGPGGFYPRHKVAMARSSPLT
jgi:hypothetical protein